MSHERPFDARLQLLADRSRSEEGWSTVSLVRALREYVQRDPTSLFPPCDEHANLLTRCADELTRRGMDAHALVRYGLVAEVVGGILGPAISQWLDPEPTDTPPVQKAQAWLDVLEPRLAAHGVSRTEPHLLSEQLGASLLSLVHHFLPWILSAPLSDLLSLEPPSEDELEGAPAPDEADRELMTQYRWAVDRFSVTRYQEWNTESLHLELKWMCHSIPPPCDGELMADHSCEKSALEAEIARRVIEPAPEESLRIRSSLTARMHSQALALLRDGKFEQAAVLFEFAVNEDPSDANALNNLGFCRLPTDPRAARGPLQRSAELGYAPIVINTYNRVLCAYLVHGAPAALKIADAEWDSLPAGVTNAHLWTPAPSGLILTEPIDAKLQLARLAYELAQEIDEATVTATWQRRAA